MTPETPAQPPAAPESEWVCPVCRMVREEPDEPIEPGDYHTVDPLHPSRCPSCGCVPGRNSEAAARVAWAREHRTVIRSHGCDSPAPECFCGSPATPHRFPEPEAPPAAPETDVRLTEAEREAWDVDPDLWPHTPPLHIFRALMDEDDNLWWRASGGHGLNAYDAAIERIDELAERVRVVEGERETLAEQYAAEVEELEIDVIAEETRANENATLAHQERARAESAEAAHEALRKGIEALADEWERVPNGFGPYDGPVYREAATLLRALLSGGAS